MGKKHRLRKRRNQDQQEATVSAQVQEMAFPLPINRTDPRNSTCVPVDLGVHSKNEILKRAHETRVLLGLERNHFMDSKRSRIQMLYTQQQYSASQLLPLPIAGALNDFRGAATNQVRNHQQQIYPHNNFTSPADHHVTPRPPAYGQLPVWAVGRPHSLNSTAECSTSSANNNQDDQQNRLNSTTTTSDSEDDQDEPLVELVRHSQTAYTALTAQISKHYSNNSQSRTIFAEKMRIRETLHNFIRSCGREFDSCGLFVTGSSVNGCGSFNCDMDMCLTVPHSKQRHDALRLLRQFRKALIQDRSFFHVSLIPASVPIVRFTMDFMPQLGIPELDIDININNMPGIYNSFLLHNYALIDERFPQLTLIVKHWAIQNNINSAPNGTFNSYSLILMVIHYLQTVSPPVLPNLLQLHPDVFSTTRDPSQLRLYDPQFKANHKRLNTDSVGELLHGFFHYYSRFDFAGSYISIRRHGVHSRQHLDWSHDKYFIYIEEPFDKKNTAKCILKREKFIAIVEAFNVAIKKLNWAAGLDSLGVSF